MPVRIVAVVTLTMAITLSAAQEPDVSTRALVARAAAYVADYQRQLTRIVADETYVQDVVAQIPMDPKMPRTRALQSEVFFMFAPGRGDWMAIRDVLKMDGHDLAGRPDVREALRTLPPHEVAATFKAYNSRYNLGRTYRNFNEPTLSLLVLDDEHRERFSFDRKRVERADGALVATLEFRERERPTLIRDLKHGHVFSRGELTIEADTGRVTKGVLTATIGPVKLELTTSYVPEVRLGLWVPGRFRELYEVGTAPTDRMLRGGAIGDHEIVRCEASYANYRRFETSVRVK
jgi:hypothetical protein